jgi:ribosome-binding factor A
MVANRRVFRVGERIQSVVATEIINRSDPRLYLVTVTSVQVSPDLRHAKVYWVVSGDEARKREVKQALEECRNVLRTCVAKSLKLRIVPELRYFYDDTFDAQDETFRLLERVKAKSVANSDLVAEDLDPAEQLDQSELLDSADRSESSEYE